MHTAKCIVLFQIKVCGNVTANNFILEIDIGNVWSKLTRTVYKKEKYFKKVQILKTVIEQA